MSGSIKRDQFILFTQALDDMFGPELSEPTITRGIDNFYELNWGNTLAMQRVYQTYHRLDVEPKNIIPGPLGYVKWDNLPSRAIEGVYDSVTITDNAHYNNNPYPHMDLYFVVIEMPLKQEVYHNIPELTSSAYYDYSTRLLTAVYDSFGAAIAIFAVIKLLNDGMIDMTEAKSNYVDFINKVTYEQSLMDNNIEASTPFTDILEQYLFNKLRAPQ